MNILYEGMWKEAVVVQFGVLSRNLFGETEAEHKNLQSWYPASELSFEPETSTLQKSNAIRSTTVFGYKPLC